MHVLGSGYRMTATVEGEDVCIVESDKYDFDNQLMYQFKESVPFNAFETLKMECTWNNSPSNPELIHDPPIEIGYGERTDEEMCFSFILAAF